MGLLARAVTRVARPHGDARRRAPLSPRGTRRARSWRVALLLPLIAALGCTDPVPVFVEGAPHGWICEDAARHAGLTVLDLSPAWTPAVLAPGPDGVAPAYRPTYLALAQGRLDDAGDEGAMARADGGLEAFGFAPTLAAVAAHLGDGERHRCHEAIDDAPLVALTGEPREERTGAARARVATAKRLRTALERERARRELADVEALAALDRRHARQVARLHAAEGRVAAVRAAQAHLACDGLLPARAVDGAFTWQTAVALLAVQRKNQLVPRGHLDGETRALLIEDSRALDHRAALRALRERVVSATGLIEDGSAGAGSQPVLGHQLGSPAYAHVEGREPLPGAAPDRIAAATEAAALALGWTSPAQTARALAVAPPRAAVELPPLPAYHTAHMDLAVEIDRGDVWYDARPRTHRGGVRPAFTLYAIDRGQRVPLVRWSSTIGGWKKEKRRHREVDTWMESPVGPRIWRDLYVAPAWLPPDTTPDRELIREIGRSRTLRRDLPGPSYRSAYGLVMLVHHRVATTRRGARLLDERVRTHGSGSIASIFDGTSHGCHRVPPMLALRLGGFLLAHRAHVRHGDVPTVYVRQVRYRGTWPLRITTRGYRVELTPPVPVEVLPGRIRSARKTPPGHGVEA